MKNEYLMVAIFQNPRWPPKWLQKKWQHVFSDLSHSEVSKNVKFPLSPETLNEITQGTGLTVTIQDSNN